MTQIGRLAVGVDLTNNLLTIIRGCAVLLTESPPMAGRKNREVEDIDAIQRASELIGC